MSYLSVVEMAGSQSLLSRISACAASEGQDEPLAWAQANMWALCATPDWDDAWAYARDNANVNVNPDTGMRDDVINDNMILGAVQALRTEQQA